MSGAPAPLEWSRPGFTITTDPARIDVDAAWAFLTGSYWSPGIDRETVARAIENSLSFALLDADGAQVGFARMVTDYARFAWLADVYVLESHRGEHLGVWLVETVVSHPALDGLRLMLATRDAHTLYSRFGFVTGDPERLMERPSAFSRHAS